ncbi:hypothetical protein [Amycolatopsis rifamycinica]|nr:hypothetical protein [Amycolatopsis rifamycinica]
MSNELSIFGGYSGSQEPSRPMWPGERREHRALERRTNMAISEAVANANIKVLEGELRKRFTEKTMYDVADVMGLYQQLSGNDATIATALAPIVQEYVRGSAREVRNFGGLLGGL